VRFLRIAEARMSVALSLLPARERLALCPPPPPAPPSLATLPTLPVEERRMALLEGCAVCSRALTVAEISFFSFDTCHTYKHDIE
jgi:hypothetical protein